MADDLLQEAYIRLLEVPLDPPDRKPYLFRVAHNLVVDHWRARRRERDWLRAFTAPPKLSASHELASDLDRLFQRLTIRERALLWLAHVEESSHAEIAAIMRLGPASVRVLLFRARRKLESILRQQGYRPGNLS
jgi:RNA polymerase sigma-70 factor (ECF subfamily)